MLQVLTKDAPQPVGPYSQAVKSNGFVYLSGQVPLTPEGKLVESENIQDHARQALNNLKAVLEAAGSSLDKVIKVNVFVTDITEFAKINEVYNEYFGASKPARSLVAVAALPVNARFEVEAVALYD